MVPTFMISALDRDTWSASRLGHFIPGKEPRYPLGRRLSRSQNRLGRCGGEKDLFPLPGIDPGPPSP
jgi:hypothetical protein